jgi:hypothetical protein
MQKYIDYCEWAETTGETSLARELGCIYFIQPSSADLRHIARAAGALSSPLYTHLGFALPSRSAGWLFALGWVSTFATKSPDYNTFDKSEISGIQESKDSVRRPFLERYRANAQPMLLVVPFAWSASGFLETPSRCELPTGN